MMSHPSVQPVAESQVLGGFCGFYRIFKQQFLFENQTRLHIGSPILLVLLRIRVEFQNSEYNASCVTFICGYTIKNTNFISYKF